MSENRNLKADGMLDRHMGVGYSLFFYFACTLNLPLIKQTRNKHRMARTRLRRTWCSGQQSAHSSRGQMSYLPFVRQRLGTRPRSKVQRGTGEPGSTHSPAVSRTALRAAAGAPATRTGSPPLPSHH